MKIMPKIGDNIYIIEMIGEPDYNNKEGIVAYIFHSPLLIIGTWGNKPLLLGHDKFVIIN